MELRLYLVCILTELGEIRDKSNTYFLGFGQIQVVHNLSKLIQGLGQSGVKLALFTYSRHCLT